MAEAVCAENESIENAHFQLVQKSLVVVRRDAEAPRYGFLETIREYAFEMLLASGEAEAFKRRHAQAVLALGHAAEPHLHGPSQTMWLDRLESEHDNARAALTWADASGEAALGVDLLLGWWQFWWMRGHQTEGRRWLMRCGRTDRAGSVLRRGWLQLAKAELGMYSFGLMGHVPDVPERYIEAIAAFREAHDDAGLALALRGLALTRACPGGASFDLTFAVTCVTECIGAAMRCGLPWVQAHALYANGNIAFFAHDLNRSQSLFEASVEIGRRISDTHILAAALGDLADVLSQKARLPEAIRRGEEALALSRTLRNPAGVEQMLLYLGVDNHRAGNITAARLHLEELIALSATNDLSNNHGRALEMLTLIARDERDFGQAVSLIERSAMWRLRNRADITDSLDFCVAVLASVLSAMEHHAPAARLYGAVDDWARKTRFLEFPSRKWLFDGLRERTLRALDPAHHAREFALGAAMTADQAVEYGLAEARQHIGAG
jgi:tetratricopeptide (TPR) repeat protein